MEKKVVDSIKKEVVDKKIDKGEVKSVFTKIVSEFKNNQYYGEAKYTVPKKYRPLVSTQFAEDISYLKAVVDLINNYIDITGDKDAELLEGKKELNAEITDLIKDKMDFCKKIIRHREEPEDYRKSTIYLVNEDATKAVKID